uniref:2-C-methyl-D-erythritol 4-phosphate cytidylyltransferase n=1 Tax=Perkinsus marinus TaxID=31276 RepID=E3W9G4_9ALVE|nr:2-C-methyl-D-erythritol 4-phosphate cytidylyltransferase [Perkinsus marinus ATCC 50439]
MVKPVVINDRSRARSSPLLGSSVLILVLFIILLLLIVIPYNNEYNPSSSLFVNNTISTLSTTDGSSRHSHFLSHHKRSNMSAAAADNHYNNVGLLSNHIMTIITNMNRSILYLSTILGILSIGHRIRQRKATKAIGRRGGGGEGGRGFNRKHTTTTTDPKPFSVILLSGGKGNRMMQGGDDDEKKNKNISPKQYLPLHDGRSSAIRAFDTYIKHPLTRQIVIVCAEEFESIFRDHINAFIKSMMQEEDGNDDMMLTELIIPYISNTPFEEPPMLRIEGKYKDIPKRIVRIAFARPGLERQDSVRNGVNALRYVVPSSSICIHDAARPLIRKEAITRTAMEAASSGGGAAVLAVNAKATIKRIIKADDNNNVSSSMIVDSTPDRNTMWEAQTPQILPYKVLSDGLDIIGKRQSNNGVVTDDVSLVEILHNEGLYKDINVGVAVGDYDNIKITTPEDLIFVNSRIKQEQMMMMAKSFSH